MKKMMLCLAVGLFTLMLASSVFAQCKIIAGWESWEPYQFKNSSGNYSGVDIDIVKAVFEEAGCKVELQEMPWARALTSIENGSLQVAMGASVTPEREVYATFSLPYRNESFALFLEKGGNAKYKITKLEDIIQYKLKLGVVRGYFYGPEFDKAMKNPQFKALTDEVKDDETNLKKMVEGGRINAFLMDPFVGVDQLKKMKLTDKIEKSSLTISSGTIHVMFSKKSVTPDTVKKFNDGLQKLEKSGKLKQIINKYLK